MYVQPDYRVPSTPVDSSGRPLGVVGIQTENATQAGAVLGNPLQLSFTQTYYVQPGIDDKLDPHRGMRNGRYGA